MLLETPIAELFFQNYMIKVYQIKDFNIMPIFKCGKSSIEDHWKKNKNKVFINKQINRLDKVTVFFREPMQRFVSGVHSFIEFEKRKYAKLDYDSVLYMIRNNNLQNEHFTEQFNWIKHLSYYFQNHIEIQPVSELYNIISERSAPAVPKLTSQQRNKIKKIYYPLKHDLEVYRNFLGVTMPINKFIKDVTDAVS